MDLSGFFSDDASLPSESWQRHGFWKSNTLPNYYDTGKSVARLLLENHGALECQPAKSLKFHQSFLTWDQKMNQSIGMQAAGTETMVSRSSIISRPVVEDPGTKSNSNLQPANYPEEGGKVDTMSTQDKNSLFSRSLSELFSRKLRSSSNNMAGGQSVDTVASHFEEEEPFESLKEIEARTIGNLLPNDDELFNGMTNNMDNINKSSGRDDVEGLDVFSSVGGLDLGDDGSAAKKDNEFPAQPGGPGLRNGSIAGEHPYSLLPSRTLFVRNINGNIEDSELRALFEQHGDIHTLYTSCKHRGFVMISYYDIRAATNAKQALQNIPLRHRKLDIHYSIPKDNPSDKDINQAALVILNLDSSISNDELRQIFSVYGEIKEIRENSHRSQHKFIEFYDVRAAEAALRSVNRSDIAGKQIRLEPISAGGSRRFLQQIPLEFKQDDCKSHAQLNSPLNNSTAGFPGAVRHGGIITSAMGDGTVLGLPSAPQSPFLESAFRHEISSSVPNSSLSSLLRVESSGSLTGVAEHGHTHGQVLFDIQGSPNFRPHSLPEYHDGLKSIIQSMSLKPSERIDNRQMHRITANGHPIEFNDGAFGSAVSGSSSLPGHHYASGNSYHPHSPGVTWPNSPTLVNGISMTPSKARLHGPPRAPPPVLTTVLPVTNCHVGSAPTANCPLWERRRAYVGESPDTVGFHPGSLGSLKISNNSGHSVELVSPNIVSPKMFPHVAGKYMELSIPPKSAGFQPHHQRSPIFSSRGQISLMSNSFESPNERARSRRNEGSINQADKKQYELDLDRILRGEDNRTTLMIKNIPNKYTSKMLLDAIDERHKGTYDFIYLPIDFKNKCNVGYAFINMIDPGQIIPFYQAFNGKKWEKFNSEKVASLAYARIQGKATLIAHFQNSSLMNEDKRCRPILFNTDGPNAGDQVPFPTGEIVRTRPGKTKTATQEENEQGSPSNFANGEDSSNGEASLCSGKESD